MKSSLLKIVKKLIPQFLLAKFGRFNKKLTALVDDVSEGDIVIDCGANIGEISMEFSKKGAIIYAFEPNPYAYEALAEKFQGNSKVVCLNKAVFNKNGKLKLFLHENANEDQVKWSTGSSLVEEKTNVDRENYVEVETIDISEFIKRLNKRVKYLKMDVEGAELDILEKIIQDETFKSIDLILVETHEDRFIGYSDRLENLKKKIEDLNITNIDLDWI